MSDVEGFRFHSVQDGGQTTLVLAGDLDGASSPLFRRFVEEAPVGPETVVDLTGVTFIGSEGLGCLFRLQQRVADAGGLLVGRGASPAIRRAIQIVQLNRVMALIDDP